MSELDNFTKVLDQAYDTVHLLRTYSKKFAKQAEELEAAIAGHLLKADIAGHLPDNVIELFDD